MIVGAGAAGSAAAEMLRRCGFTGSVTMVDADPAAPCDRPNLSKDYLAGSAPEEWIPLRPDGFHAEHDVAVVRGTVTRIDTAQRRVELEDAGPLAYDALLLATGAEPSRLQIPGSDLPHVHALRSLADSRAIIDAAERVQRVVVIGASFIGLEVAASLRARDLEVHVVAPEPVPLGAVLGETLGTGIRRLHEDKGVVFHLGRTPSRISAHEVVLDDGTTLEAELVVVGIGVRPRLALAEQAGLALDRGVTVDEQLRTSAPNVWAAGDIARWPDPHSGERIRVEHWVVAQRMGQTAARNMLGAGERFDTVPFFWSAHYDATVAYVGHADRAATSRADGSVADRDMAVRWEEDGRLTALATIFRDDLSLQTERAMERRVRGG